MRVTCSCERDIKLGFNQARKSLKQKLTGEIKTIVKKKLYTRKKSKMCCVYRTDLLHGNWVPDYKLDSTCSQYGPMAEFCDYGN
jgi:hypothetical protein